MSETEALVAEARVILAPYVTPEVIEANEVEMRERLREVAEFRAKMRRIHQERDDQLAPLREQAAKLPRREDRRRWERFIGRYAAALKLEG
jgi:oligoendopeptidase F